MTAHEQPIEYTRNGTQPDNFVMMPNMAIDDLSPNAYKLLAVYLDMTRTGDIYARNNTVAERLGMSVNTMKKARKELSDKKYIISAKGKEGKDTTTAKIAIQVDWMWRENHIRAMQKVSNSDNRVSNSDTPPHQRVSNSDTIKQNLNIKDITKPQEKKKDYADKPHDQKISPFLDDSHQGLYAIVAKESFKFADGDKIPKSIGSRIGKVVKAIRELEPMPTVAELSKAYRYRQETQADLPTAKGETTVVSVVQEYRKSSDYRLYESQKDMVMQSENNKQDDAAPEPPAPLERPLDWQPTTPEDFAWIDAQPDYPIEPEEAQAMITAFEDLVKAKTSKKLVGKTPPGLGESA